MTPLEVDELADEMFAAMVRHMQLEAEAINKQAAKTKLPVR
jgi:hypothetical protein